MNTLWSSMWDSSKKNYPLHFVTYDSKDDLQAAYWREPLTIPVAIIFEDSQPISGSLLYEIRTNPSFSSLPPPTEMYSSPVTCRKDSSHWMSGFLSFETGGSCPVNSYFTSGFMALQLLMDTTKIKVPPPYPIYAFLRILSSF